MSVYLDASLIVSSLANEPSSRRTLAWLSRSGDERVISDWIVTEVASALAMKVRVGEFSIEQQGVALAAYRRLEASLDVVPVGREHFREAARLCGRRDLGVRASDALHLAVVLDHGYGLCTLDRTMAAAAVICGIAVERV